MTKKAAVMGWPVNHSLSPKVHGYWLDIYGIDGTYELYPVTDEGTCFEDEVRALKSNGFVGVNVTIPFKERALFCVDEVSDVAQMIGAVNTIVVKDDGSLFGTNTDAYGFIQNILSSLDGYDFKGKHCLCIGAGGAARAVIYGLLEAGAAHVHIVNRTQSKAKELISNFPERVGVGDWGCFKNIPDKVDFVVNTTSLGMVGQGDLPISFDHIPPHVVVTDVVYNPLKTSLLRAADKQDNPTVDGLGMLLYQAVAGFEYFFGTKPEVTDDLRHMVLTG